MAVRKALSFVPVLFILIIAHLLEIPGVSGICAPVDHDIKVLKDQDYWQFELTDQVPSGWCDPFKPADANSSTCVFYFSICHPVPRYCPDNSGICLANKVVYKSANKTLFSEFRSVGSFIDKFEQSEANFFTLEFGLGMEVGPLQFASTVLKFQCDRNSTWIKPLEGNKVPFPPNVTYVGNQMIVTFKYSKACKGGGGGGDDHGGGGEEGPAHALSVGSILLILFFPGLFLYCVVGVLINRGAGKTGRDAIPNSKFWSDLPGLISDGFSFAIAKITCSEMSTTRQTYDSM